MDERALEKLGFDEPVHQGLQALIARCRHAGQVAVFDFDNTCILHDIGELYGQWCIATMAYRYDDERLWALVDPADGRDELRRLARAAAEVSPAARHRSAAFWAYFAEMSALYGRKLAREGKEACYRWAVRLHVGMEAAEVDRTSRRAIAAELARPLGVQTFLTRRGERIRVRRGVRIYLEMRRLMRALEAAGITPWIVSATNQWTVRVFAQMAFGIPAERVIGNRVSVDAAGRLTDALVAPALFGPGKVRIIEQEVGQAPCLVVGDSETDFDMLCQTADTALLIDCGSQTLRDEAARRGWLVQPQHTLTRAQTPQEPA